MLFRVAGSCYNPVACMFRAVRQFLLILALVASGFALMTGSESCSLRAHQNACAIEHLSAATPFAGGVPASVLPEQVAVAIVLLAISLFSVEEEPVAETRDDLVLRTQHQQSDLPRRLTDILAFSPQLSAVRDF
jgi:hypothetical protein